MKISIQSVAGLSIYTIKIIFIYLDQEPNSQLNIKYEYLLNCLLLLTTIMFFLILTSSVRGDKGLTRVCFL